MHPAQRVYSDEEAIQIIGMGMWRLQGSVDAVIEELVAQIEGAMRCLVDDDDFDIEPPEQVSLTNTNLSSFLRVVVALSLCCPSLALSFNRAVPPTKPKLQTAIMSQA